MTPMKNSRSSVRWSWAVWLAVWTLLGLVGCHAVDYYEPSLQKPLPPEMEPPRELNMVSEASYQVEPPDVLMIEMLKLVPLPPYRIDIFDVLQIKVIGTLLDQPVDGFFLVEAEGIITLGPAYGTVRVAGMTNEEAAAAITRKLSAVLSKPEVSVQLARTAGTAPITGEYLVMPDGTVNLRQYGSVQVAGKTVPEIRRALQKHLNQFFDAPDPSVEVRQINSKVFYVITEGGGLGDNVRRIPISGTDTVLDALSAVNGLSQVSSAKMWVARPAPGGFGCEQILPVDYAAITRGASTATNYQLMPGDRVFIEADSLITFNTFVTKVTAPVERLLGIASLGTSFGRSAETMGREYNRTRF
jgi:polysaccharide export outer membrane protein